MRRKFGRKKRRRIPDGIVNPLPKRYDEFDNRPSTQKLAEIVLENPQPVELISALENTSSAVWVLWMHLVAVPASRPELRALLCHIWDGITSDTQLAAVLGVHRHTVRKWKKELCPIIEELPLGSITGIGRTGFSHAPEAANP